MPLTTSNNITRTQSLVSVHCTYPGHRGPIYCEHDRAPEQPPSIDRFDPKLSANTFISIVLSIHKVDSILTWWKPQTMHVLRLSIVRLLLSSRAALHSTMCCCRFLCQSVAYSATVRFLPRGYRMSNVFLITCFLGLATTLLG